MSQSNTSGNDHSSIKETVLRYWIPAMITGLFLLAATIIAVLLTTRGSGEGDILIRDETPIARGVVPQPGAETTVTLPTVPVPTEALPDATPSGPFVIMNQNIIRGFTSLNVLGEIENVSENYYAFVTVAADFFDADGKRISVRTAYSSPTVIAPRGKAAFDITLFGASELGVERYELFVSPGAVEKRLRPAEGLAVIATSSELVDSKREIVGVVRNDGEASAEVDEVIGTFYNADGLIVAVETDTLSEELNPGEVTAFKITLFNAFELGAIDFLILVDAQPLEVE